MLEINPGLGDGQSGDDYWMLFSKINSNFTTIEAKISGSEFAASRRVGKAPGQIPLYEQLPDIILNVIGDQLGDIEAILNEINGV